MNTSTGISLAIPTYNRYGFLLEAMEKVVDDSRISEIIVSDDKSTDGSYERLQKLFTTPKYAKVKLRQNANNLDCYRNKCEAVLACSLPWVILLDDDNVMDSSYVDALYRLQEWDPDVLYLPELAKPSFDYRQFAGLTINRSNVASFLKFPVKTEPVPLPKEERKTKPSYARRLGWVGGPVNRRAVPTDEDKKSMGRFKCSLNTGNYFLHRENWLSVWDGSLNPHTSDTIYQNHNWLSAGKSLFFVPGMHYYHRIHTGSHFKLNQKKTGSFEKEVERMIENLI